MLPIGRNSFVNRIFDDFAKDLFDLDTNLATTKNFVRPSVNIKETEDNFVLEFAVPGLTKEDFKVEVVNNLLTVSAEKKTSNEDKEEKFLRREFSYQTFKRSFTLGENTVDDNNISATYTDGVLSVTLPKKEAAKEVGPKVIAVA